MPSSTAQGLNFDILSIIYTLLWELRLNSQLIVAAVCRNWREAALTNPRLWTRIYPDCMKTLYTSTYLSRSGSLPLHITLSWRSSRTQIASLSTVTDRIICLKGVKVLHMPEKPFPTLERLEFGRTYREDAPINSIPTPLEALIYPNLRHLNISNLAKSWVCHLVPKTAFPLLQSLNITCTDQTHWREIVTACAGTLVSLYLVNHDVSGQGFEATLPRLRSLWIKEGSVNRWTQSCTLRFDAPCLHSVYRSAPKPTFSVTPLVLLDAETVTDVEIRNIIVYSAEYTGLRTFWIQFPVDSPHTPITWLRDVMENCPLLECIRYAGKSKPKSASSLGDRPEDLEEMIHDVIQTAGRTGITVERFDPEDPQLPGLPPRDVTCDEIPCVVQY